MNDDNRGLVIVLLILAWLLLGDGGSPLAPLQPVTSATYVYEKDDSAIPSGVMGGLNRLNREGKIVATIVDKDVVDGNGQTPEQYKVPIASAKEAGLPSLVVMGGSKVIRVVKSPKTEEEVMEAAK